MAYLAVKPYTPKAERKTVYVIRKRVSNGRQISKYEILIENWEDVPVFISEREENARHSAGKAMRYIERFSENELFIRTSHGTEIEYYYDGHKVVSARMV